MVPRESDHAARASPTRGPPCRPGVHSTLLFRKVDDHTADLQDPNRQLRDYRDYIMLHTGNHVSLDTISRFFLHGFPYKGNLMKPNLIPLDKFKPENEIRAFEFLNVLFDLNPEKVIFADEKSVKGEDLYNREVRRNPITGEVPAVITPSDFRNAHAITSFCSISPQKRHPCWFRILSNISNDKEEFYRTVELAINDGYFEPHDVLCMDRATIHNEIEEMLWQRCRVLVLFLPTRSPEWNPKELVWQTMVKRMKSRPLRALQEQYEFGARIVAHEAALALSQTTIFEVREYYAHCYSFLARWRALSYKHG